jgi:hypothetical protein
VKIRLLLALAVFALGLLGVPFIPRAQAEDVVVWQEIKVEQLGHKNKDGDTVLTPAQHKALVDKLKDLQTDNDRLRHRDQIINQQTSTKSCEIGA